MRQILIVLHLAVALIAVATMCRDLGRRAGEVAEIRAQARADREMTERMQRELDLQRNLIEGLRGQDPYVVELLARDRFGYTRPGELSPPPLPAVDTTAGIRR